MVAISKVENLKQTHIDYILLAVTRTSNIEEIKSSFQAFFETGIKGEVLLEFMRTHKDTITELQGTLAFEEKTKGIKIADPAEQLQLLDDLYKKCLIERVHGINREGVELSKPDLPTAARCIEISHRIRMAEKSLEIEKRKMVLLEKQAANNEVPPPTIDAENVTDVHAGPVVRIVHKKDGIPQTQ
jgi:hypothetical protein